MLLRQPPDHHHHQQQEQQEKQPTTTCRPFKPPNPLLASKKTSAAEKDIGTASSVLVAPVGPLCPFSSPAAASELEPALQELQELVPPLLSDMARLRLELSSGVPTLEPDFLFRMAHSLERTVDLWHDLMQNCRSSMDFQMREYAAFTHARLAICGKTSLPELAALMKWQSQMMTNLARNVPPPPLPEGMDMAPLLAAAQQEDNDNTPKSTGTRILSGMFCRASPQMLWLPDNDDNDLVLLVQDLEQWIQAGSHYGEMNQADKLFHLQKGQEWQDQWQRCQHRVKEEWVQESHRLLQKMGLSGKEFQLVMQQTMKFLQEDARRTTTTR